MRKTLEQLKIEKKITYGEMCKRMGCTYKTLRQIKNMSDYQRMHVHVGTLLKIKHILGVDYISPIVDIINNNIKNIKKLKD